MLLRPFCAASFAIDIRANVTRWRAAASSVLYFPQSWLIPVSLQHTARNTSRSVPPRQALWFIFRIIHRILLLSSRCTGCLFENRVGCFRCRPRVGVGRLSEGGGVWQLWRAVGLDAFEGHDRRQIHKSDRKRMVPSIARCLSAPAPSPQAAQLAAGVRQQPPT